MNRIEYSNAEISILEGLIGSTAQRVIYNFMYYIFDFGAHHVLFSMDLVAGISKTGEQELKYTKPDIVCSRVMLEKTDKIIAENFLIEDIQILRTVLYWEKVEKESIPIKIGSLETNNKIASFLNEAFCSEVEIMIKPSLLNVIPIDTEFANLADVGVKIKSNGRHLVVSPLNNCFGFTEYQKDSFWPDANLLNELEDTFEFIDLKKI